jgi:excisionase family DNA binding protein
MVTEAHTTPLAVSVEEAARRAGVGRGLLYQEIGCGRLRAHKAGRRTLIAIAELSAWLNALPTFIEQRDAGAEVGKVVAP